MKSSNLAAFWATPLDKKCGQQQNQPMSGIPSIANLASDLWHIYLYMYHELKLNAGKYTIRGSYAFDHI